MTRKRFVKLMMSHRVSRNAAVELAAQVSQFGSYAAMYQMLAPTYSFAGTMRRAIEILLDRLAVALYSVGSKFQSVAASLREGGGDE